MSDFGPCSVKRARHRRPESHRNDFRFDRRHHCPRLTPLTMHLLTDAARAKTTFVASISHELRSPLHGILGTLEFIKDTKLDPFQGSMLNSLSSCGQTLLDTINQVMDFSKTNESNKTVSSRRLKSSNTLRLSSKPLKTRKIKQVCRHVSEQGAASDRSVLNESGPRLRCFGIAVHLLTLVSRVLSI